MVSKIVCVALILIACAAIRIRAQSLVFHVQHPDGPKLIKTLAEAETLCNQNGAVIAESWRFRDAVLLRHYWPCKPCGWMALGRNYRGRCNDEAVDEGYYPCADTPEEEGGEYSLGYDTYCWGDSSVEIPPDAVAIDLGEGERGYVYILEEGRSDELKTESVAQSQCGTRRSQLATMRQLFAAWNNGFSQCQCAWLEGYQAMAIIGAHESCGDFSGIIGCHYGKISSAICYIPASDTIRSPNVVDFSVLKDGEIPLGVEAGATEITGGYVYPTRSELGEMRTRSLQFAHMACRSQNAKVATEDQLYEAYLNGLSWCECGYVWTPADSVSFEVKVISSGKIEYPAKRRNEKCGQTLGVIGCPAPDIDDNEGGYNVFCFKNSTLMPVPEEWRIPPRSVRIKGGRVYHVEDRDGKYKITSNWFANKECSRFYPGAVSATKAQLQAAVENGLTRCRCGYVGEPGEAYMPMYRKIKSCGDAHGLLQCSDDIAGQSVWDAWCFISDYEMNEVY